YQPAQAGKPLTIFLTTHDGCLWEPWGACSADFCEKVFARSEAGMRLGRTVGRGHPRVHHQSVPILRHQVSVVAQLRFLSLSLAGQHGFRIAGGTVRLIARRSSPCKRGPSPSGDTCCPDIEAMKRYGLDLSSYEQVKEKAPEICATLEDGSMRCDEHWPKDKVGLFKRWMDEGMAA